MFIDNVVNSGAIPALGAAMSFAAQRQKIIAHNIANMTTPDFRPLDVSVTGFQRALGEAVDARRERYGGARGPLELRGTREFRLDKNGFIRLTPRTSSGNILFHDRNNRDLERTMQALAENAGAFRVAADLLRNRYRQLHSAIAEQV